MLHNLGSVGDRLHKQHYRDILSGTFELFILCLPDVLSFLLQIKDLPSPLFHCAQLKVLHISDNKLEHIPEAIGSLVNLAELDLSRNC